MTTGNKQHTAFSFEVLPPLRGKGMESIYCTIDKLMQFNPVCINITTHRAETIYSEMPNGAYQKLSVRNRPGTVAIAAAIKERYHVHTVPHIICSGFSAAEIESELIDLSYLGITELLLLRGDKAKDDRVFTPVAGGHAHTTDLIEQVNRFNSGYFADGSAIKVPGTPFGYGVACYPEKHDEAPNMEMDMGYLKMKQDMGAEYAVTQLFYDNSKYFDYVDKARAMGITIPIIPGIKPLAKLSQLTVVPKTFHCDLPQELAAEVKRCKTDDDAKQLGIEWATHQCQELYAHGINNIHFYTVSAVDSVAEVTRRLI